MKFILSFLRLVFPFLFASNLQPFSLAEAAPSGQINPFPRGRYQFMGRSNGASRHPKQNRLRVSKLTRNKHR